MFRNRFIFHLFIILLIFAVAAILPIVVTTNREIRELMAGADILLVKQNITSSLISISFYVFIVAFILALFFSRKVLLPARALHKGAMSLRDGNLDTTLEVSSRDELGEVIEVFNEMAASLRHKTGELETKNREIRESRDFLEIIMDSIEDEILIIDPHYRVVKANRAVFERMEMGGKVVGIQREASGRIIGQFCHVVSHNNPKPCFMEGEDCPVKQVLETGKVVRAVHQHLGPEGEKIVYEILACPIKDGDGNVLHVIELLRDVTELKLYEAVLSQKNKELTVINSIAALLSHSLDTRATISNVVSKLMSMLDMEDGGIFFIDGERKKLVCALTGRRLPLGGNILGRAVESSAIQTVDHIIGKGEAPPWLLGTEIRSCCCVPLKGKEGTVGVLYLMSSRTHSFTAEERRMLSSVGDMTGIALENTRLYDRIRSLYEFQRSRREREHNSLLALSSRLTSATDIREAIDTTLNMITDSFDADLGLLLVLEDNNRLVLRSVLGDFKDTAVLSTHNFGRESIEWVAVETRKPVILPSVPEYFDIACPIATCESAVSMPVCTSDKTLGVFSLYFKARQDLREEDIHFLEIVSSIFAVAMERSEFYENMLAQKGLAGIVFDSISDGLYTVDTDYVITSVNKAAERILGIPAEGLIGRKCVDVVIHKETGSDKTVCGMDCPLSSALAGTPAGKEMDYIDSFGKRISVYVSCAPLISVDGALIGAVEVFRDITREKEINRMKTEFVTTVSHEFRTPLSAIVGMTEMLADGEVKGERAAEYVNTMLREGRRLSDMVSDLLDISRIEAKGAPSNEIEIDFHVLLDDVVRTFSDIIRSKNIHVDTHVDDGVRFFGDGDGIKKMLLNLFSNSATYCDSNCVIAIEVRKKSDEDLVIEVSDTGWGIPGEDIPLLGRRFFRGKHGIKTKGTGLGLSLCKEIAELHGGVFGIESKLGRGTVATVDLPVRRR
ncbi:MAG TPA: GAF domain-containing protein [Thermodesulfovibrionales bacterium]|nr:GAF domain-containing protein [Thermodesulfovibrionales bacterium]